MKLASLETLSCDAGWRPWLFVKATADEGLNIDDEDDFERAEELVASGRAQLPAVEREPYPAAP